MRNRRKSDRRPAKAIEPAHDPDDFAVEVAQHRANARLMEFLDQRSAETERIPITAVREALGL